MVTNLLFRTTAWLTLGWLAVLTGPKRNPRWELAACRLMIAGCLLMPSLFFLWPPLNWAVLPRQVARVPQGELFPVRPQVAEAAARTISKSEASPTGTETLFAPAATTVTQPPSLESAPAAAPKVEGFASPQTPRPKDTAKQLPVRFLPTVWLCGTAWLLARLCLLVWRTSRLVRSEALADGQLNAECHSLALAQGLSRPPKICISSQVHSPCTAGWLTPVVLLPPRWDAELSPEARRAVLVHELAHLAGRDSLWDLLARIATACWWFHPLVWGLVTKHRLACEHRCDSVAADAFGSVSDYRQLLAAWVLRTQSASELPTVLAMASNSALVQRVERLAKPLSAARLHRGSVVGITLLAAILAIVTASLQLTAPAVAKEPAKEEAVGNKTAKPQPELKFGVDSPPPADAPGPVLRVRVLGTQDQPLKNAKPLLEESQPWPGEFTVDPQEQNLFVLAGIEAKTRWLRVIGQEESGPLLFSELIDIKNPSEVDPTGAIVAKLRPGIRLTGRLDDSVPRPIKHGQVELYIREAQDHRIQGDEGWSWQDAATIQPDGAFEFPALPAGGHVQLFALVEGFHSRCPSAAELETYLAKHNAGEKSLLWRALGRDYQPQLFPLPKDQPAMEIELPCTPTAAVDVRVVDPLGQPIVGAQVIFSPNLACLGSGVILPGYEARRDSSRLTGAAALFQPPTPTAEWSLASFYRVKTNDEGIAKVRNVPANRQILCRVEAAEYVVPSDPESPSDSDQRFAVMELAAGATQRRTITMERPLATVSRDLAVMDAQGKPVTGIQVTGSELAFAGESDDWQFWSVARFGPIPTATSNEGGEVRLELPREVEGRQVEKVRVIVAGKFGQDGFVQRKRVALPLDEDGKTLVLTRSEQVPLQVNAFHEVNVTYVSLEDVRTITPHELLVLLQQKPSLPVLKRLLAAASFDAATPLAFRADRNSMTMFSGEPSPVSQVSYGNDERVVVLCDVRPKGADWDLKPLNQFPPEAAFVFNWFSGELIAMIGGWQSEQGHSCSVNFTELGMPGDYFVECSAFEENGPFEYLARWTKLGQEERPALTVQGYANAMGWSAGTQSGPLTNEFGYTYYGFNSRSLPERSPGLQPNGVPFPRKIFWDGRLQKFVGPESLTYEGKPLFQVVAKESAAFEPITTKPSELLVAGGRRSYENWHAWDVIGPEDQSAEFELSLQRVFTNGSQVLKKQQWPLPKKMCSLQLHVDPAVAAGKPDVEVRINDQKVFATFDTPAIAFAEHPSMPGERVVRTAEGSMELLRYPTAEADVWLVGKITAK